MVWQISQLIVICMPVNLRGWYILCCLNNPLHITYLTWLMEMNKVQYMIICLRIFPSQLEKHGHVWLVKPKDLPKYPRNFHCFYLWNKIFNMEKRWDKSVTRKRPIWGRAVWQWKIWWTNFMKRISWVMSYAIPAPMLAVQNKIQFWNKRIGSDSTNVT